MPEEYTQESLPVGIWDELEYTSIHTAVLFADLENSVMLSSTLNPNDYQRLVNDYQRVMLELVDQLHEKGLAVAEYRVAGDQLSIFFYHPEEVLRNYMLDGPDAATGEKREQLVTESRITNESLSFDALKAAIQLKNTWLVQDFNLERVRSRREPLGLAIGIHTGRVHLCNRHDGERRIEGYTVNLAKRIEGFARHGKFSRIMLSEDTKNIIRGSVRKHTQLRQRIFFYDHEVGLELLKGITRSQSVSELKFYSLIGITIPEDAVEQYEALFALDTSNIWAYYQLFEHYAYVAKDWDQVVELSKRAQLVRPHDEKVLLDLSRYHSQQGSLDQAQQFAERAIAMNEDFDLAYEHLAMLAARRGDELSKQLQYLSKGMSLAPGSPVNHLNLGLVLCQSGHLQEGAYHILEALRIYPDYAHHAGFLETLAALKSQACLPKEVEQYIYAHGFSLDAAVQEQ